MNLALTSEIFRIELLAALEVAKGNPVRTIREFAENEIFIPDGPYEGTQFSIDIQPFARLLFDEIDSSRWTRFIITGPSQSGKTLIGSIIPLLYHLFEIGETVIFGLPDMDMAYDKWKEDIEPVIMRTRYANLIPTQGSGSRGGKFRSIRFLNGATLRFMSAGGGDKSRAGFTSRVLIVTETDGFDTAGENSREADKVSQLEARTNAYDQRRRIYLECTLTTEEGRTWVEYTGGSRSRIACPCPHCKEFVSPERENFIGYQEATSTLDARENAAFVCPSCGVVLTAEEREAMNRGAALVHNGQTIGSDGAICGDPPRTSTLGFRWSAFNNLLQTPGFIGENEYAARNSLDEEIAEKKMLQFFWAMPYKPDNLTGASLEVRHICSRTNGYQHRAIPPGCVTLSIGVDIGKFLAHYVALGSKADGTSCVVDYGAVDVPSDTIAPERAIAIALAAFESQVVNEAYNGRKPDIVLVDAGYEKNAVYNFVRTRSPLWMPYMGFGQSQMNRMKYTAPKMRTKSNHVKNIGERYHISKQPTDRVYLIEGDADHWKTFVKNRMQTPMGEAGAMSLFAAGEQGKHITFAKHLCAERCEEVWEGEKGWVVVWKKIQKANHYLDALYMACLGAHYKGIRLGESVPATSSQSSSPSTKWSSWGQTAGSI